MNEPASTLATLVSPFTEADFLATLRRREFAFRPGAGADRFAPLVGWQALRHLLEAGNYPTNTDSVRLTKESVKAPPDRWMTNGKADPGKLDQFLAAGFSIVIVRIEPHIPALAALCEDIKARTGEGAFAGVIVTAGTAEGAFRIHFDPEDLLILQVEGTKRWQIFGPPVANPLRNMPKPPTPETEPLFDEVLEAGDMLFVPAGYWHHCESGLSTSVHLGIFFLPPTGWHAVNDFIKPLLGEEIFRTPLTRLDGSADLEAMEASVKSRLIEKINELKFDEFLPRWSKIAY